MRYSSVCVSSHEWIKFGTSIIKDSQEVLVSSNLHIKPNIKLLRTSLDKITNNEVTLTNWVLELDKKKKKPIFYWLVLIYRLACIESEWSNININLRVFGYLLEIHT